MSAIEFVRSVVLPAPVSSRAAAVWESRVLSSPAQPPMDGVTPRGTLLPLLMLLSGLQMPYSVLTVPVFPVIVISQSGFPLVLLVLIP